ncbi:MAG: hypothetical protein R3C28_23565 [Pirellulaceae bacterium]
MASLSGAESVGILKFR